MKVERLIRELQKAPADADVMVSTVYTFATKPTALHNCCCRLTSTGPQVFLVSNDDTELTGFNGEPLGRLSEITSKLTRKFHAKWSKWSKTLVTN